MTGERNALTDQQVLLADRAVRCIFDVGANNGDTAARFRAAFPDASIHCFEPSPREAQGLAERFRDDPNVVICQAALSDHSGTAGFYINRNSVTNSLLPSTKESAYWTDLPLDLENLDRVDIPVTTIHSYCGQHAIPLIDILKIDAQGSERLVLEGAAEQLQQGSISLIQAELQIVPVYEGQVFFYELAAFLAQYGYQLFGLYEMAYAANGQAKWCDAIFLSPNVRARYMERTKGGRLPSSTHANGDAAPEPSEPSVHRPCRDELARVQDELLALRTEWQAVRNSAGWRLLNSWREIRNRIAPQNSVRRHLYDSVLGTLRGGKSV